MFLKTFLMKISRNFTTQNKIKNEIKIIVKSEFIANVLEFIRKSKSLPNYDINSYFQVTLM